MQITDVAQLDRKIVIKTPVVTVADSGQQTRGWAVWRTTFAKVVEQYGNEGMQAGAVVATTTTQFLVRYRAGLTHDCLIEYNGNTYNILAITEAQFRGQFYRDRFTQITATTKDQPNNQQY